MTHALDDDEEYDLDEDGNLRDKEKARVLALIPDYRTMQQIEILPDESIKMTSESITLSEKEI